MLNIATSIVKKLTSAGFRAYFAGGCVRDMLLGLEPKDYDIATNAKPEQIESLFAKTVPVGKQFGVILVIEEGHHFEIATFRSDSGYSDGRRPDAVLFTDPREDAKRRDFTINGMFYDPIEEKVLDYVNGQRDLHERLINFIGNPKKRIHEDRLRIIRAVRFAHQIKGQYHPSTYKALKHFASLIETVSKERLRDELNKILLLPNRAKALEDLADLGILDYILPELIETKGMAQPLIYHQEGSVWKHMLRSVHSLKNTKKLELIWATLLHDIGKSKTFQIDSRIRFNEHDQKGKAIAHAILRRLKFPRSFIETVCWLIAHHMMVGNLPGMTKANQAKWVLHPHFKTLLQLHKADASGAIPIDLSLYKKIKNIEKRIRKSLPKKLPKLVSGRDVMSRLNLSSGPKVGKILENIHEKQLEGKIKTRAQALELIDQMRKSR